MAEPIHIMSGVDPATRIGSCCVCGPHRKAVRNVRPNGRVGWTCFLRRKQSVTAYDLRRRGAPKALHRLSCVDRVERTAVCAQCGPVRILVKNDGELICCTRLAAYVSVYSRARRRNNPQRRHDMPGGCEICGRVPKQGERALAYDHDHVSGLHRGWLCHHCNLGLGHFRDSIPKMLAAVEYQRKFLLHLANLAKN